MQTPEFHATRARLDALIHPGEAEADGPADLGGLDMVTRMASVGDEVE
jgi:NitT/TauT family transport system ATP-binding protein